MRALSLLLVILSLLACGDKTPVASKPANTPTELKALNASFTQRCRESHRRCLCGDRLWTR